jgi:Holliday junction resolvasome RuvABC endonuclease subunit
MSEIIVVGLDMSLSGTGVCRICGGKIEDLSTISTGPKEFKNIYKRIDHIIENCIGVIEGCGDVCELAVIESPFVRVLKGKGGGFCGTIDTATKNLMALNFMIRRELSTRGIRFIDVAASQLKKFILGKGAGEKSQILKAVYKHWNVDAADDNQADSCVLANIGKAMMKKERGELIDLTTAQAQVIEALRW